mgnify:CR=1 FL=1
MSESTTSESIISESISPIPKFEFVGQPLSEEQSRQLMALLLNKDKDVPLAQEPILANEKSSQMILKRIEAFKLPFTITAQFMIASIMTWVSSPGKLVALLWLCHNYHKQTGKTLLNIEDWTNMFPWGTPTDKEFGLWWDKQKCKYDNKVDLLSLWK